MTINFDVATVIMKFSAVLIALGVIFKYLFIPVYKTIYDFCFLYKDITKVIKENSIVSLIDIEKAIQNIDKDISVIKKELTTNGGTSIKDTINQIKIQLVIQEHRHFVQKEDDIFWEANNKGEFVKISEKMCHIFGMSTESMINNGWQSAILASDRESVFESWKHSNINAIPWNMEFRIVNQTNHETVQLFSNAYPVFDQNKSLIYWVGTIKII
jgi:PAS domain S-box-containing protein